MISCLSLESGVLFISESAIAEQVHTGNETQWKSMSDKINIQFSSLYVKGKYPHHFGLRDTKIFSGLN